MGQDQVIRSIWSALVHGKPDPPPLLQDVGQRQVFVIGVGASLNSGELGLFASGPAATHVKRTFFLLSCLPIIPANVQPNRRVREAPSTFPLLMIYCNSRAWTCPDPGFSGGLIPLQR